MMSSSSMLSKGLRRQAAKVSESVSACSRSAVLADAATIGTFSQFGRLPDGVRSLKAGHLRHAQVHHDQVRKPLPRGDNCCLATCSGDHLKSQRFE